jgi:hypothetical protein
LVQHQIRDTLGTVHINVQLSRLCTAPDGSTILFVNQLTETVAGLRDPPMKEGQEKRMISAGDVIFTCYSLLKMYPTNLFPYSDAKVDSIVTLSDGSTFAFKGKQHVVRDPVALFAILCFSFAFKDCMTRLNRGRKLCQSM